MTSFCSPLRFINRTRQNSEIPRSVWKQTEAHRSVSAVKPIIWKRSWVRSECGFGDMKGVLFKFLLLLKSFIEYRRVLFIHGTSWTRNHLFIGSALKHKDSFGKSENLSKIFFAEILVFDHDYEGKSSSSNGLLWISFIKNKNNYLNYFSNCSEGLRTNLYTLSTILCKV